MRDTQPPCYSCKSYRKNCRYVLCIDCPTWSQWAEAMRAADKEAEDEEEGG